VLFLEQWLQACFNTIKWDKKKVTEAKLTLFNKQSSNINLKEAHDYMRMQMQHWMKVVLAMQAVNNKLCKMLDDAYLKHMDHGAMWRQIGSSHKTWVDGYHLYLRNVVNLVKDQVAKWLDSVEKQNTRDNVKNM
jgi:hypothetical protein